MLYPRKTTKIHQFQEPVDVELALQWRFWGLLDIKLALERRFREPWGQVGLGFGPKQALKAKRHWNNGLAGFWLFASIQVPWYFLGFAKSTQCYPWDVSGASLDTQEISGAGLERPRRAS